MTWQPEIHKITNPCGTRCATLTCAGEIRSGPPYYSLTIDGYDFGDRVFGEHAVWSADGEDLAVCEWLTTREADGPRTTLFVVRPTAGACCRLVTVEQGFVRPLEFVIPDRLRFLEDKYQRKPVSRELEITLPPLANWSPLP